LDPSPYGTGVANDQLSKREDGEMPEALHAMPDCEVMQKCLDGIHRRKIPKDIALQRIRDDAGWMPVAIEPGDMLIYFVNIGQRQLSRWQFVYSIESITKDDPNIQSFAVSMDLLEDVDDF